MSDFKLQAATLGTERLQLRAQRISDAEAMYEIYSDAETMKYWSSEPMKGLDEAQKYVAQDLDAVNQGRAVIWSITEKNRDVAIGKCILFQFSESNRRAEVGYVLNRQYWGRGIMSEAMAAVIEYAFGDAGLHRLEADTDPDNAGSLKMLERLGFQREGLFRDRWFVYGVWQDSVMLGLLKTEWEKSKISE